MKIRTKVEQRECERQNMSKNMISIIIPVFNQEDRLARCVESILLQTYKNLEIILVDDGSTDLSPKLCDEYSGKDNRIKTIHKENGGVSSARNMGLQYAKGDFIMFVDSDDYIKPNYCQNLVDWAKRYQADIVCTNIEIECEDDVINNEVFYLIEQEGVICDSERIIRDCCDKVMYTMTIWSKLYKRGILKNLSFSQTLKFAEDTLFARQALWNSKRVALIPDNGYVYIKNAGSITIKDKSYLRMYNSMQTAGYLVRYCEYIKSEYTEKAVKQLFEYICGVCAMLCMTGEKPVNVESVLNNIEKHYTICKKYNMKISVKEKAKIWMVTKCFPLALLLERIKKWVKVILYSGK